MTLTTTLEDNSVLESKQAFLVAAMDLERTRVNQTAGAYLSELVALAGANSMELTVTLDESALAIYRALDADGLEIMLDYEIASEIRDVLVHIRDTGAAGFALAPRHGAPIYIITAR